MEDASYDLSLVSGEDGEDWEGSKGWMVYTNEAGKQKELTPDGYGGYLGLDEPGQTFYFSRLLNEKLESPTIQLGTVDRTVSVFLDDTLLYTDCPEQDNRIGYLKLPMLEWDRTDKVVISLPPDYRGRTLTIAQSTPEYSDKQGDSETVYPCSVKLYCGYAYESSLIAASAKTLIPTALLFALELLLLAAFIWNATVGKLSLQLPVAAMALFFQFCSILAEAKFSSQYIGIPSFDLPGILFHLSVGALLLFLSLYAIRLRPLYLLVTAMQWISTILCLLTEKDLLLEYSNRYLSLINLPYYVGSLALLAITFGSFFQWKKGSRFYRHMAQTSLLMAAGYGLFLIISPAVFPDYAPSVFSRLMGELTGGTPIFSLRLLRILCMTSALIAVIIELLEQEAERRSEFAVLSAKNKLALESYENLRRQSEEVMMLRHDTMKHYALLRTMAEDTPEKIPNYLDELIGQVQDIRPVVSSRNQILNILVNGKLNAASSKGISTEIVRSDAPEKLPLTDTELCSLIVNILDNAINGAAGSENPSIKLDFHCKDQYFVFSCENSVCSTGQKGEKAPAGHHGYGLKIIRQIMDRWGDHLISVEQSKNSYQITLAIPLA